MHTSVDFALHSATSGNMTTPPGPLPDFWTYILDPACGWTGRVCHLLIPMDVALAQHCLLLEWFSRCTCRYHCNGRCFGSTVMLMNLLLVPWLRSIVGSMCGGAAVARYWKGKPTYRHKSRSFYKVRRSFLFPANTSLCTMASIGFGTETPLPPASYAELLMDLSNRRRQRAMMAAMRLPR